MLSRLFSSIHRITVDIEAVLAKSCLQQNIAIIVTFLELYTLSFLIFRLWMECETWTLIIFFLRRWSSRNLLKDLRFAYYSVEFILQTISLFTPNMAFVRNFSRKSFFTVFLHNWVVLFIPTIIMATSSVDFSFNSSFSPTNSARTLWNVVWWSRSTRTSSAADFEVLLRRHYTGETDDRFRWAIF